MSVIDTIQKEIMLEKDNFGSKRFSQNQHFTCKSEYKEPNMKMNSGKLHQYLIDFWTIIKVRNR